MVRSKAAKTNLARDPDYYRRIGAIGNAVYKKRVAEGTAKPRGFATNPALAAKAGAIGGKKRQGRKYPRTK